MKWTLWPEVSVAKPQSKRGYGNSLNTEHFNLQFGALQHVITLDGRLTGTSQKAHGLENRSLVFGLSDVIVSQFTRCVVAACIIMPITRRGDGVAADRM